MEITMEEIKKLKKNAVKQNIEINKLAKRNKILEDMIIRNQNSIIKLFEINIRTIRGY